MILYKPKNDSLNIAEIISIKKKETSGTTAMKDFSLGLTGQEKKTDAYKAVTNEDLMLNLFNTMLVNFNVIKKEPSKMRLV